MGRLVEYVVIAGIKRPNIDSTQPPELLRRFPTTDHKDFPLPPDIVFFCQPEGCATALRRISLRQTNTFVFTLTDKDTAITRYGICCNFFRPCFGKPQHRQQDFGKSYSYDSNSSSEDYSYKAEELNELKRTRSTPLHSNTNNERVNVHKHVHGNSMLCFSLTSVCIVSSYPFFSTFRECLFIFRKLVESRSWTKDAEDNLRKEKRAFFDGNQNIGHLPLLECRNWSTFLNSNDLIPNAVKSKLSDIDDWVNNLLKIPLPIAGHNRVEVELLPRHLQPPLTFALPEKSRFAFLDYPVHLPLELLGVETCLKILICIILEHKVVLQSCDYNALSISVMALTSMFYPLQYMFPIIPLLPTCMKNAENLLLAPTPYVIGIPSSFFRIKGASFQVPHDVLIVDLDTNKMSVPLSMDEIPALPEPDGTELKAQLNECLSCLSFSPPPADGQDKFSEYPRSTPESNINPMIYGNDIDSVDIAVRAALVKFFCSPNVLGSFMLSTRILRLYSRPVVAFLKKPFIHSKDDKSGFLEALIETQAVEYYGEWMVNPENTVFRKVQNGILDPRIIGDKPRWYSHYVHPLYYQVHNPQSQLGLDIYEDSDTDSEDPDYINVIKEDNEESDKEEEVVDVCSCCSSFDDSDLESTGARKSGRGSLKDAANTEIHQMYDTSYFAMLNEQKDKGMDTPLMADSVYTPPAYRSEDDIGTHDALPSPDDDEVEHNFDANSEVSSCRSDETPNISNGAVPSFAEKANAVKKLSAIIGHMKPKRTRRPSTESLSSIISSTSIIRPTNEMRATPLNNKFHTNVSNQKIYRSSSYSLNMNNATAIKQGNQDQSIYNSENQQFVTEVVAYVKSGDGIGWLTTKRLRKIVVDEGLRQYLINQIDMDSNCNETTLNDVHVSRNVYRGYLELLKLVIEGYEHSMRSKGLGGLSSMFSFLEVTHRYYCGKKYTDDSVGSPDTLKETTTIADMVNEECTQKIDPPDVESECSLHFHRELSNFRSMQQDENTVDIKDNPGSPSLTFTSLQNLDAGKVNPLLPELTKNNTDKENEKKGIHLISKSNCSGGHRFYNGYLEKSVFESAGRDVTGTGRRYLFEGLFRNRSSLWDDMDFWEQCFLDCVAAEREAAGMDVNPIELISRYNSLNAKEKRSLEEDEDKLLGIILHNMIAFMVCTNVSKQKIRMKVRRLLAKAHIGLNQTQQIDDLLSSVEVMHGNDIDLLVPRSRQLKIQIFVVHLGDSQSGPVFFLEVRDDCVVLKSTNGSIVDRWWYENVVNLSCSPKTKVLCLWIRSGEQTDLQKVCTKKCKLLYSCIKDSMKKAAEKLNKEGTGINLGGDFTIMEPFSQQEGILKVSLEGLTIIFVDKKIYVDLLNLKNCCAKRKVLIVEEYLPHTQSVMEHKFYTEKANEICYAILCLFSYIAAARNISTPVSRNSVLD